MQDPTTPAEIRGDKVGKVGAVIGLVLFLLLLFIPLFFTTLPKPGQPGILVNLGMIDLGQGNENAGPSSPAAPPVVEEVTPPLPQEDVAPLPPPPPTSAEPQPTPVTREVVVTETPQEIAIRKQKAREEARKKSEADRKRRDQLEVDRRAKTERDRVKAIETERRNKEAAEAAVRREAAEKAQRERDAAAAAQRKREEEAAATRNRAGGLFGGGGGQGNTGKPGNQGVDNGDPDSKVLEGVSTGDGRVSGGLGGRGVLSSPVVRENSQRPGRVVVDVCVGPDGKILSANYTQSGSTTTDPNLVSAAQRNALQWKFQPNPSAPERQCGKITYDFKVQ
ncbi:cell envelope integrity protein TolA [Neolewinella antarctica]|uniref:Outer membrane biosynthesis protein TonB n=1 Tax=Neolewinella antarctica TaxID=442734 RepID=A0ABX0X724_9BACT|nr:cell envelope integrity protein TolA [Neolewinella antarctica]NJC25013.1 outer membrane biosynthesis protein TonB [Neolewinella antarctica]